MNNSWERNRNLCLLIGIATIAIGSIFMMTGIALNDVNFIEAAKWLMAIGLSLISIGIACHAVVISNKSDEKMIALTNLNFTEKHAMMQIYIQDFKRQDYNRAEQCKLDFEAAIEVKEWASPEKKEEYIEDLIKLINTRLETHIQEENIRTVEEILISMIDKAIASKMTTKTQTKTLTELEEELSKHKKKIS